jgi:hypothetical protein
VHHRPRYFGAQTLESLSAISISPHAGEPRLEKPESSIQNRDQIAQVKHLPLARGTA